MLEIPQQPFPGANSVTLRYVISVTNWSHQDVILLGNRVFRDVISKHEVMLDQDGSWIQPLVCLCIRREDTQRHRPRETAM